MNVILTRYLAALSLLQIRAVNASPTSSTTDASYEDPPTDTCVNTDGYIYDEDKIYTCKWIVEHEDRRQEMCLELDVALNCPISCGYCCENDQNYEFQMNYKFEMKSGGAKKCSWLADKKQRQEIWCGEFLNEKLVKDGCPEACGACFAKVTTVPSSTPSISSSPTEGPTIMAECADSVDYVYDRDETHICKWVGDDEDRRQELCLEADVALNCPLSCGYCCENDAAYRFLVNSGDAKKCKWLNDDQNKQNKWCDEFSNGQLINDGCPKACGTCFAKVSHMPSSTPSSAPSASPSLSKMPTSLPSTSPSFTPSLKPSDSPSALPSLSKIPSSVPSTVPSSAPSLIPSKNPSSHPSLNPIALPSLTPSKTPSSAPSRNPSALPSDIPSLLPSTAPSLSKMPSSLPSTVPSSAPSLILSNSPSSHPSLNPSALPSMSRIPSLVPSTAPSSTPSIIPSSVPSSSSIPSFYPSVLPSVTTTSTPSRAPSPIPSNIPSLLPSTVPSSNPSVIPSSSLSSAPSLVPTILPSVVPVGNISKMRNSSAMHSLPNTLLAVLSVSTILTIYFQL